MKNNNLDDSINVYPNGLITAFPRNRGIEKKIDDSFDRDICSNGIHLHSISIFLDRLDNHVQSYKSDKLGKTELFNFLKYNSKIEPDQLSLTSACHEYLEEVASYIDKLKKDLQVESYSRLTNQTDNIGVALINQVLDASFNIQDMASHNNNEIRCRPYGFIFQSRRINFIYIENDCDIVDDVKNKPACVLYQKSKFNEDKAKELMSIIGVIRIICFDFGNYIKVHSKNSIATRHRSTYFDLYKHLSNLYGYSPVVIENLKQKTMKLSDRIMAFEESFNYSHYKQKKHKFETEIKQLKAINQRLIFEISELPVPHKLLINLESFTEDIGNLGESYFDYYSIDNNIHSALSQIKKNRFLYRGRNKGDIFSEENLSSILKSMLELKFNFDYLHVTQEEINGAGFSDIEIKIKKETISIIECKLIQNRETNNTDNALRKGIDQILSRYSNTINFLFEMPPKLYLILFCVDPEWNAIRKKISDSLDGYCIRNKFDIKHLEKANSSTFSVKLTKSSDGFGSLSMNLDIIICELEDRVDLDRLNFKNYSK